MADMKISDLPAAADAVDAQQFEVNDSGTSRRVTFQQMRTKIKAWLDGVYAAATHNHDTAYAAKSHNHSDTYAPASHTHPIQDLNNSTATGRALLVQPNPEAVRSYIGAGTGNSNLAIGSTATTAKAGNWKPRLDADTTGQLPWSRLSGIPEGAAGLPQALGVGSYVMATKKAAHATQTIPVGGAVSGSDLYGMYFDTPPGDYGFPLPSTPVTGPTLSGTWRNMGGGAAVRRPYASPMNYSMSLFLRIA